MAKDRSQTDVAAALLATKFGQEFKTHIRAGYACLKVQTHEESRAMKVIDAVAQDLGRAVVSWDYFDGWSSPDDLRNNKDRDPRKALAMVRDEDMFPKDCIFIFKDVDDFFKDPAYRRGIRSLVAGDSLASNRLKRTLVILTPGTVIHPNLRSCITTLKFDLPNDAELGQTLDYIHRSAMKKNPAKAQMDDELRDQLITDLRGLDDYSAANAISATVIERDGFGPEMRATLRRAKAKAVDSVEALTYIDHDKLPHADEIAGYDDFFVDIRKMRGAYSKKARDLGIAMPNGIVLLGPPGTGKSFVSEVIARELGLSLYKFDFGAVFASHVGESEATFRMIQSTVTAQQGCVLFLDEVDKSMGGAHNAGGDSGVTKRIFGMFLQWTADKNRDNNDRTFIVMTMNRTDGMAPEMLRTGRFDAVYSTDLPDAAARQSIFDIHLRKANIPKEEMGFSDKEWTHIIKVTKDHVGSDIEQSIKGAQLTAFHERETHIPMYHELIDDIAKRKPLAKSNPAMIKEIRKFCKEQATPVQMAIADPEGPSRNLDV